MYSTKGGESEAKKLTLQHFYTSLMFLALGLGLSSLRGLWEICGKRQTNKIVLPTKIIHVKGNKETN